MFEQAYASRTETQQGRQENSKKVEESVRRPAGLVRTGRGMKNGQRRRVDQGLTRW